jgi:DNA-binding NtrC family response regulator
VLETGQFTRLGATTPKKVNVRIVCATHKNLEELVNQGSFRHDLWYRLCAFVLRVPPLDERREDIELLADTFLQSACMEMQTKKRFSQGALERLKQGAYPGNIRELKHVVTRAVVFCDGEEIQKDVFDSTLRQSSRSFHTRGAKKYSEMEFRLAREQFEKDYFSEALENNRHNITATAAAIGMAQSNLSRKLKELGLR